MEKYFECMKLISYSEVFGKKASSDEIQQFISQVSSLQAVELLSYQLCRYTGRKNNEDFAGRYIFMPWLLKVSNETQQSILKYFKRFSSNCMFIDKYALLSCIDHILSSLKGTEVQNTELDKNQFTALLKLYLSCCDERVSQLTYPSVKNITDNVSALTLYLPVQMKINDIEYHRDYRVEFIKIYELMRFCNNDESFHSYLNLFIDKKKLVGWSEYLYFIFSTYLECVTAKDGPVNKIIALDKSSEDYFDILSVDFNHYEKSKDFVCMRSRPVVKTTEKTYTVAFFNFLVDKLYQGFLFDFASTLSSCVTNMNYGRLKSELGENFAEHYLFYSVINGCFHRQFQISYSGTEMKQYLSDGEPDYYLRRSNRIVLFEFKDVTLDSETKHCDDFNRISHELRELFVETTVDKRTGKALTKPKKKGVSQLADTIQNKLPLILNNIDSVQIGNIQVFPIIVYQDINFDIEGVNYIINKDFTEMIKNKKLDKKYSIKPIVMIPLYLLIQLEDFFANNRLKLTTLINQYINKIESSDKKTMMTFSNFLYEEAIKKGYNYKKTERFQFCIDELKQNSLTPFSNPLSCND